MRHARLTWVGAFHHVMNKGLGNENIFLSAEMKQKYIQLLTEKSNLSRIRIFCYCVMDNHFHLVLENASGKLSDFMKQLNSSYGIYYRKSVGGKGYVFQDRFRSTLIQDEAYLLTAIKYVLQNPVEAGISPNFLDYTWSSARLYFRRVNQSFVDMKFVENLFISKRNFIESVNKFNIKNMIDYPTKFGRILGTEKFIKEAEEKYDRRKTESIRNNKRKDDMYFESIEKVYYEFERKKNIRISEIDINSHKGKRLRGELLILLRDKSGLKYREIKELPEFSDIKFSSLGSLYSSTKQRLLKEKIKKTKDRPHQTH